jgi:hypothetical protein
MASTTAPSPAATEPQKCCAKCSEPCTRSQFWRNHIKTHVPVEDDDSCCICREEYRAEHWNTAYGRPDVPCQVVGITGCNHIFGCGCLTEVLFSSQSSICPLCATPYFVHTQIGASSSEAHKNETSTAMASMFKVDYATARFRTFGETHNLASISRLRIDGMLADSRRFNLILCAIRSEKIQDIVTKLQDTTPSPIDARLYNLFTGEQVMYVYDDHSRSETGSSARARWQWW